MAQLDKYKLPSDCTYDANISMTDFHGVDFLARKIIFRIFNFC